jgi:hypothetical protein
MSDSGGSGGRRTPATLVVTTSLPAAGVVLITVHGPFGANALSTSRQTADDVLALDPTDVVLDLSRARCDATTVPVLALLRRYAARRGARIGLTSTSRVALAMLRRAGQIDQYRVTRSADLSFGLRRTDAAGGPAGAEAAS